MVDQKLANGIMAMLLSETAEKNGYYYLIDDTGNKDNLLTVLPIKEHSFK